MIGLASIDRLIHCMIPVAVAHRGKRSSYQHARFNKAIAEQYAQSLSSSSLSSLPYHLLPRRTSKIYFKTTKYHPYPVQALGHGSAFRAAVFRRARCTEEARKETLSLRPDTEFREERKLRWRGEGDREERETERRGEEKSVEDYTVESLSAKTS